MLTLYAFPRSGNSQKVRMALAFLGLPFEEIRPSPEERRTTFLDLNPLGQVPVLRDGDLILRDSQAILVYLAATHAPGELDGFSAAERGAIVQWLSVAAREIAEGPALLRASALFDAPIDKPGADLRTTRVLKLLDDQLARTGWLEGGRMTIADLACAPYIALAPEGGVDLGPWPNITAWVCRLSSDTAFPAMEGWSAGSVREVMHD